MVAAIVPPTNLMPVLPAARVAPAASVSVPPQPLVTTASNKIMLPGEPSAILGKMSVNVADVKASDVGFDKVIERVDEVFCATVLGAKDLLIDGAGLTVSD